MTDQSPITAVHLPASKHAPKSQYPGTRTTIAFSGRNFG